MKGFKEFLMRGNVLDLAVAVIIGAAFGKVVEAFTKIIMDVIGLFGGQPDFSQVTLGPINVGVFITALVSFVIVAAIVYFFVIVPVNRLQALGQKPADEVVEAPSTDELLVEIRDLLAVQARR